MAQRSSIPKFGNWESEENVQYTTYFDQARKGKDDGKMNPNDHQDVPGMFSNDKPPFSASPFQMEAKAGTQSGPEAVRSKHERRSSKEDGDLRRQTDYPLRHDTVSRRAATDSQYHGGIRPGSSKSELEASKGSEAFRPKHERRSSREEGDLRRPIDSSLRNDTVGRRAAADLPHQRHGGVSSGDTLKRATRQSAGSDRSIEHSPLHPHNQARVGSRGSIVSSPSWERKGSSEGSHGFAPSTPGRSRLRSVTRGDETPDHSAAVPKFGEWDESNPSSADGYTHIFNRVREERQTGAGKVPVTATENSSSNGQKQYRNTNTVSCCCFPWGGK
ncbi:hypothetical protein L1049_016918 [Liquidambar formosana]|uniref:RIN4 pathogenic type III effector avirulence factor Avr cleavage site domain-containing protein n=1 Tax=Liquidambar formosana TaxID=63359 RepID=A0AAP0X3F4_LIQFO